MNNIEILKELKHVLRETFNDIKSESDKIISFGILTDFRAQGLSICYNTKDRLEQKTQEHKLSGYSDTSFVIWDMNEWIIEVSSKRYEFLSNWLYQNAENMSNKLEEDEYRNYSNGIFDLMLTALLELKEEGVFNEIKNEDFFLYLSFYETPANDEDINRIRLLLGEEKFLLCKKECLDWW